MDGLYFEKLTPLNVNFIFVFFCVVVSNGIETLVFESSVLEFLLFSFSVVDDIGMGVFLIGIFFSFVDVDVVGIVCLLVVLGRGLVVVVEDGLLNMVKGVTLGLCVVIAFLVNVGFDTEVPGLRLSKLFGRN